MTVAFNVYFQHYFPSAYKAILRSTVTVFNVTCATGAREIQIISLLWEVTQTRKTPKVCHENVIIFQCIQIGKLELVKILI